MRPRLSFASTVALGVTALLVVACEAPIASEESEATAAPRENWARDIEATHLEIDLPTRSATATIRFAASSRTGASLEVGGLEIDAVTKADGSAVRHSVHDGQLDLALPARTPADVTIRYRFDVRSKLEGLTKTGVTFLWPHFCGNLYPCKSDPADGLMLTLDVRDDTLADGESIVFAPTTQSDAPSYMLAWARGAYERSELGTTTSGTRVSVFSLPGEKDRAARGTEALVEVFDWLETTYGAYTFGDDVGSVSAKWGAGAFGGMEHHPYWHVASEAMDDAETHAHEATHGWFGDGVRIACWEDLVLSEGTTSYVTARALEAVRGPDAGDEVWRNYEERLDSVIASSDHVAWPSGCGEVDVLGELWTDVPYMKGAFFFRAVEREVGREALDRVLSDFYADHVGRAASMHDLLDALEEQTGFDPEPLARGWLQSLGRPDRD
jgi:aminopeptidase N